MVKIGFTKGAEEKHKMLMNGVKGAVESFLKDLEEDKIKPENLEVLFDKKENVPAILYKNLEKINVILAKRNDGAWIIFDFLTPQDFNSVKRR